MAADCVFCSIVAGETAAEIVLDEPDLVAFLDARPVFKGHTLLVTREHVVTLADLPAGPPAPRGSASRPACGAPRRLPGGRPAAGEGGGRRAGGAGELRGDEQ